MEFPSYPAPHMRPDGDVGRLMREVCLALVPGALAMLWYFGWGVLINLLLCAATALASEAAMLQLRGRSWRAGLADGSALLTGLLLALCLPPLTPWWIPVIGTLSAIVLAKHLYGGLGYNPFNPAMVGFVVLLISFPLPMTLWPAPRGVGEGLLSLADTLRLVFAGLPPAGTGLDAVTMATPLDTVKTGFGLFDTWSEITASPLFGALGGTGWQWINAGFLAGGLWMLKRGLIQWQIPAAMLGALFVISNPFFAADSDGFASPVFHLFSGATMLGAFFIATDPVTAATTPRGRLWYGAGIGVLVYLIRTWGGYPDGVAFAVLLMNMAVPVIDHYTRPRVFGHRKED